MIVFSVLLIWSRARIIYIGYHPFVLWQFSGAYEQSLSCLH